MEDTATVVVVLPEICSAIAYLTVWVGVDDSVGIRRVLDVSVFSTDICLLIF